MTHQPNFTKMRLRNFTTINLTSLACIILLPASIHAKEDPQIPFPWAGKVFQIFNDADSVRSMKNETIGGADVPNQPGSTKDKDLAANVKLLGYQSPPKAKDHDTQNHDSQDFKAELNLTGDNNYDVKLAVLADDVATVVVRKKMANNKFGEPLNLKVAGGALWRPDSYKESDFTLVKGSVYEIKLHYENKFQWVDGNLIDVDGVSLFCYRGPELVLKNYNTEINDNWADRLFDTNAASKTTGGNVFEANAASKITGGDVYLKAQENDPLKGDEIKLRLQLREKFTNLKDVADRYGKLTLRTYGKKGWKVPTTENPLRTIEIDLQKDNIATLVGPQNDELRIHIPYEKVYADLVNDNDQAEGDVWESFSADDVAADGGSLEDSDLFDENLAKSGAKWRGSLRKIWKGDPPVEQPINLPAMPIKPRLVKAAGTVFLQAAFAKQNLNSINNALLQNQADIIYVSSHCDGSKCSADGLDGLPSTKLKSHWDQDADVIIIAACHNLRIAKLDLIDYIFDPIADSRNPPETAGLDWLKNISNAKVLLGYRFKAPRDIIRYRGKDYEIAKSIVRNFIKKTNGGKGDADMLAKAWLEANKENAKSHKVGVKTENPEDQEGSEQRPYNACAIDVKSKAYYYWHHETWDGQGAKPEYKKITIP